MCDFYFSGMVGTIPKFSMGVGGADELLQGGIEVAISGHNVTVINANSGGANFVCPSAAVGKSDAGYQFYVDQDVRPWTQ